MKVISRKITVLLWVSLLFGNTLDSSAREGVGVPGLYDKPFIIRAGSGTSLGGYIDHELFWNDGKKTFDQHRFIPFIHGEVSERIHVMAEIEFEHGGLVKGSGATDGEIKLEFATLDISFSEGLNYRGRNSFSAGSLQSHSRQPAQRSEQPAAGKPGNYPNYPQ